MYDWEIISEFTTSGGDPKQWWSLYGEAFILGVRRVGGPGDSIVPRRLIADGVTREAAHVALHTTLRRYDPTYRLLPAA